MFKRIESGIAGKGFGFDYISSVRDMVVRYDLVGIVFEKKDGSIKLIAEGEEENLIKLTEKLEDGSLIHSVENFYVKWDEPKGEFKDFSIGDKE